MKRRRTPHLPEELEGIGKQDWQFREEPEKGECIVPVPFWILIGAMGTYAAYVAVHICVVAALEFLLGRPDLAHAYNRKVGIPLGLIEWVCYGVSALVTWPKKAQRVFCDAFGVEPEEAAQDLVDQKLGLLADPLEAAFEVQVRFQGRWQEIPQSEREAINARVQRTKKAFWDAHGAAKKFGFKVEVSWEWYTLDARLSRRASAAA